MCSTTHSRRGFLAGTGALAAATLSGGSGAAQAFPILCSWSGGGDIGFGLAPASGQAANEVASVMRAIGLNIPMQVYTGGVTNAVATTINGLPAIVYNPGFMNQLWGCNSFAAATVLGHEVGHHANRDTQWQRQFTHSWNRELGADWVSGLAMRRLGVSLQDATSGIQCSMGPFSPGSPSHPDSQRRLQAISAGWYAG